MNLRSLLLIALPLSLSLWFVVYQVALYAIDELTTRQLEAFVMAGPVILFAFLFVNLKILFDHPAAHPET